MGDRSEAREAWEYAETGGGHRWAWPHVVVATLGFAAAWSVLMYVLTLVLGRVA